MRTLLVLSVWLSAVACRPATRFEKLSSGQTGIHFANTITESDTFNALNFEYIYNGAGVGVGDFNGDGLPDVFFAGNQVTSRLYVNRGQMVFDDVTASSGTATKSWCTGVAVVDINQDGRLDIYVCTIYPGRNGSAQNILFLNEGNDPTGIPHFRDVARTVGLADRSYSTQAAFLDYDRDGDLDCFLLNNALESYSRNSITAIDTSGNARSVDKLFRHEGNAADGLPRFRDVSRQAGIREHGWGLGVGVADINRDGWPDIYCANDFQSNDVLYVNDQRGGFRNRIADYLSHQAHNSMGVDIADINNDGYEDIAVVDMMPDDNLRQKTMFANTNYDAYERAQQLGYQPQFVRNMLQLNHGPALRKPEPDSVDVPGHPVFSDIGYFAGVQATDWSWSALFADFDNDGRRDLLITNGYRKDITDQDFISYRSELSSFGADTRAQLKKYREEAEKLPGVEKPNVLFWNRGSEGTGPPTFENRAAEWGLDQPSYTNGAAYADFDNDGDLDLVMNNLNAEAFVYRNTRRDGDDLAPSHFLRIRLLGKAGNRDGLGAYLTLHYAGEGRARRQQVAHQAPQRGYKSSVDPVLHVGLGEVTQVDTLDVTWPDGQRQRLLNVPTNQTLVLRQTDARLTNEQHQPRPQPLFTDVTTTLGLRYRHEENLFVDFKNQPALPHMHSMQGPGLGVGDVNGDGLDDVYIGGPTRRSGTLFLQEPGPKPHFRQQSFTGATPPANPFKLMEETGVLLFDADGDHDLDLYCVGGGSEFYADSPAYQDALYLNDGKGKFTPASAALPDTRASGSCAVAADVDADGDLDLFVGGRVTPGRYPDMPRSYLLRNDGTQSAPRFTDITEQLAPGLARVGMVTAACWTDANGDHRPDLLLVGEWMAPTLFQNAGGRLHQLNTGLDTQVGWYSGLTAADFDGDGDEDYVAGNLGLNSYYRATPDAPVSLYAKDFDNSGTIDPVLTQYVQDIERPTAPRGTLIDQLVGVRQLARTYADYGRMALPDLLSAGDLTGAQRLRATQFQSVYLENRGTDKAGVPQLVLRPLPAEAQLAPLNALVVADLNHDRHPDLLAVGNSYAPEPLTGRYDASVGNVLLGDGRGGFHALPLSKSGFCVQGDVRSFVSLRLAEGRSVFVAGKNNGWLQALSPTRQRRSSLAFSRHF